MSIYLSTIIFAIQCAKIIVSFMDKRAICIVCLCFLFFASCNREWNELHHARLEQWDTLLQKDPEAVSDSLATFRYEELSRDNRAYYGLLKTIADDKTYTDFTSDSLINDVEAYYRRHRPGSNDHIRALIYQAIIRTRIGHTDSTVWVPLKKAETHYLKLKKVPPTMGYMIYYHLGDVQYNNANYAKAGHYYIQTLQQAKQEKDFTHLFDAYLALCWNEMARKNIEKSGRYLDSVSLYVHNSPDNRFHLLNAQSYFAKMQKKYAKALELEKEQISLAPHVKAEINLYGIFYSVSDRFYRLNQLDSAMHYALQAIEHIDDSTYSLNYLLYENVADIAEKQQDFHMANRYRKKTFEMYQNTIEKHRDTQIKELEIKYNHAEMENKAMKTETRMRLVVGIVILLTVILFAVVFAFNRRRKILQLENKNKQTELLLAQQRTLEQERTVSIIIPYLSLYTSCQNKLKDFTYKTIEKKNASPETDKYNELLKSNREDFNKMTHQLFTDELLGNLLKTRKGLELFKHTDRVLLFMLAVGVNNSDIAGLLHSTSDNLKAKKSYLKKKIQNHIHCFDNPDYLLSLFISSGKSQEIDRK